MTEGDVDKQALLDGLLRDQDLIDGLLLHTFLDIESGQDGGE